MEFKQSDAPDSRLIVPQVDNIPYNEQEHKHLNELNLILVGDQGVGKTQLIKVYSGKEFDNSAVTVGVDFFRLIKAPTSRPDKKVRVVVWDTAGAEKHGSLA